MTCPRKIFLLAFQGWQGAPELVQKVRASWEFHNPGWDVICLDATMLNQWMDVEVLRKNISLLNPAAMSDIVRLNLLNNHGGVWADATMLCTRPLDAWVDEAVAPEGFWMYHGRDKDRGPASWFMASVPGSTIISRWAKACNEMWDAVPYVYEYFWMDRLFSRLAQNDPEFLESWKGVPFLSCNKKGSAVHLTPHVYEPENEELLNNVFQECPFAVKLHWKGELQPGTNASRVIDWALTKKSYPPVQWGQAPSFDFADFFTTQFPRKVFIDCGTHFSQGLKWFMETYQMDYHWVIHTFEANPITYAKNKEMGVIPFVNYHHAAVAARDGTITMNVESPPGEGETGMGSSIIDLEKWRPHDGTIYENFQTQYTVPSINLARFILENVRADDVLIVKMDIEGAEYDVIENLIQTGAFFRIHKMAVEWHAHFFTNKEEMEQREQRIKEFVKQSKPDILMDWH